MKLSYCALLSLIFLAACSAAPDRSLSNAERNTIAEADSLRKAGKSAEAVAIMREAEARHPASPALLGQLGYALIEDGQVEEAVNVFDRLIVIDPDSASGYNGKAVAFDKAGNHLAAQDLYQQALIVSPKALNIRNNLAMSMILNGQIDDAVNLLEVLNEEYDNKTVRQNLARAYGLKGDTKKALAIGLKDLPPEKAKANVNAYRQEAKRIQKKPSTPGDHIGFIETPPSIAQEGP